MLPKNDLSDDRIMALIGTLSSTLKNIDAEFEFEVARVQSSASPDLKPVILGTVQQRHMQRREPYVRQLAELRRTIGAQGQIRPAECGRTMPHTAESRSPESSSAA